MATARSGDVLEAATAAELPVPPRPSPTPCERCGGAAGTQRLPARAWRGPDRMMLARIAVGLSRGIILIAGAVETLVGILRLRPASLPESAPAHLRTVEGLSALMLGAIYVCLFLWARRAAVAAIFTAAILDTTWLLLESLALSLQGRRLAVSAALCLLIWNGLFAAFVLAGRKPRSPAT